MLATEFTSAAAPRTVLQAAIASEPPINTKVITLRSMLILLSDSTKQRGASQCAPFRLRNFLESIGELQSDRDRSGDVGMGVVIFEDEVLGLVIEQPLAAVLDDEVWKRPRVAAEL